MCGSPSGGCGSPAFETSSSRASKTRGINPEVDSVIDELITSHKQAIQKLTSLRGKIKSTTADDIKKALQDMLANM